MNTEEQKQLYTDWLSRNVRKKGTVTRYLKALKCCNDKALEEKLCSRNLFLITDVLELQAINDKLFALADFAEFNKQHHFAEHSAFRSLIRFRKGIDVNLEDEPRYSEASESARNGDRQDKLVSVKSTKMLFFDNQSASNSSIHSPSDIRNTIFYGPPGTGKTFKMQQIRKGFAEDNAFVVTFHQSFSYEEFVEGLKPVLDSEGQGEIRYQVEAGVFKSACERAASLAGYDSLEECAEDEYGSRKERMEAAVGEGKCVLLCIDEINRGNIAAIFGELISLIEESKRLGAGDEMLVELPYSKTEFGVPMNLWLVGTMNTADRSIQLLDSALRRRFKFSEMLPDYKNFESDEARLVLQNLNSRLRCLLGKDSQVGHAYLMKAKTPREILEALVQKVIPLLEEYFYSDTEKVRFVLNEGEGGEAAFYTLDEEAQAAYEEFVAKGDLTDEDKNFYVLNPELNDLEALDDEACEAFLGRLLGTGE